MDAALHDRLIAQTGRRRAIIDSENQQHEITAPDLRENLGPVSVVVGAARCSRVSNVLDFDFCGVEKTSKRRAPSCHRLAVFSRAGIFSGGVSTNKNRRFTCEVLGEDKVG